MKILYYFPELSNPMLQWQRVHIIDELKYHGIEFDIINPLIYENVDKAHEACLSAIDKGRYDLFMTCLCNNNHIRKATVEDIKRRGIPTMSFRADNLSVPYNDKDMASTFDLIWLTSYRTKGLYDKWGAKTIILPYAANPYLFLYRTIPLSRKVCFIGNPHGSRASVINYITQNGIPMDVYYGGNINNSTGKDEIIPKWTIGSPKAISVFYDRLRFQEGRIMLKGALIERVRGMEGVASNEYLSHYSSLSFEEMIEKYSEYALSLSFSSYARTDCLHNNVPVVNLRNFEVPMCGGVQICRYCDEMNEYFEDGKEVVLYRSEDEMIDKLRYYLNTANESEIRQMKKLARLRSENEHTWYCRFRRVFDVLGLH